MDQILQQQTVFHLTGQRPPGGLDAVDGLGIRPALLARYRDLTELRYDFPLVLAAGGPDDCVRSLSAVVDTLLRKIAPRGIDGEGLRRQVLRVEREIRRMIATGMGGTLDELWAQATARLADGDELATLLTQAGEALDVDGVLVDCDRHLPERVMTHVWQAVQQRKARKARATIDSLIVRLNDILRADFVRSDAGQSPESLRAAVGGQHRTLFDFEVMSRLIRHAPAAQRLSTARRYRIERSLAVLRAQRFFAAADRVARPGFAEPPYDFAFNRGADAIAAFRERLPELVELVKAMTIAELEADGRYVEATHDGFFDAFGERALGPRDLEQFPDYLVRLAAARDVAESEPVLELLSSGIPLKVLAQVDDLLEGEERGTGHFAYGVRSAQVASAAVGLTDCFVLQSTSSNLYQMLASIERGMTYAGPALFSVFSGAASVGTLPPYLVAAAALQSRAFASFTYDPAAGSNLAARFSVEGNPQPEVDWPAATLEYADHEQQRVVEPVAFTFLDFVASDPRHARHFAGVPATAWTAAMVPAAEWLAQTPPATGERVPYLWAVDDDDVLRRVIADDQVVQAAHRCRETWCRLQELGGVHNSHAERLLERAQVAWQEQKAKEIDAIRTIAAPAANAAPVVAVASPAISSPAAAAPTVERAADEAYIETIRCSSCNECTQINDRMFAYNDDKQAYIKDVAAGNYRQLVEAAESCQLSIIHPGQPRDPDEPGLAELLERAKPFH